MAPRAKQNFKAEARKPRFFTGTWRRGRSRSGGKLTGWLNFVGVTIRESTEDLTFQLMLVLSNDNFSLLENIRACDHRTLNEHWEKPKSNPVFQRKGAGI